MTDFFAQNYRLCAAGPGDAEGWMRLVHTVAENFPGLEPVSYRELLDRNIARGSALCVKYGGEIVGALLYSLNNRCLSWMAVHPAHRRRGVGGALVAEMLGRFPAHGEIWVSTFRADDPLGDAPRALYGRFGFVPDALTVEHGYPGQKFVLRR